MAEEPAPAAAAAAAEEPMVIVPPEQIKAMVDKTAEFVARNGEQFEAKIAGSDTGNKFGFLVEKDPYNAYYRQRIKEIRAKTEGTETEGGEKPVDAAAPPSAEEAAAAEGGERGGEACARSRRGQVESVQVRVPACARAAPHPED